MDVLRRLLASALLAAGIALPGTAVAQTSATEVKAAFLPRFARYVTWPPSARPANTTEPFNLCVVGGDPFGRALDQAAASQTADGHRVVVRRLSSAAGAGACHIAFIQGSSSDPTGEIMAALGRRPILTVTDARNGAQRGIIHFTVANGRVRFFIDDAEAAERGLTISSRLLALAIAVRQR